MLIFMLWYRFNFMTEIISKQTIVTSHTVTQKHQVGKKTHWTFSLPPYPCGVSCLGVIFQDTGHAKVRHFADQVAVD